MVKRIKTNEKKMNPIIWLLCAIVIPIVVALTLLIIILSVSGVDVGGWAKQTGKNIPVMGALIPADDAADDKTNNDKALIAENEKKLARKDEDIQSLSDEVNSLKTNLEDLEQENVKLEHQLEEKDEESEQEDEEEKTEHDSQDALTSLSQSFKDMSPKQAAQILQELDEDTAVSLLKKLPTDVRGDILGKMNSEMAAKMTELYLK